MCRLIGYVCKNSYKSFCSLCGWSAEFVAVLACEMRVGRFSRALANYGPPSIFLCAHWYAFLRVKKHRTSSEPSALARVQYRKEGRATARQ